MSTEERMNVNDNGGNDHPLQKVIMNKEEWKNMKKKPVLIVGLVVVCIIILAAAFASAGSLNGQWNVQGERNGSFPSILILRSEGSAQYDGFPVSWAQKGNILQIAALGDVVEYRYTLSGNTLNLFNTDGEKVSYSRSR